MTATQESLRAAELSGNHLSRSIGFMWKLPDSGIRVAVQCYLKSVKHEIDGVHIVGMSERNSGSASHFKLGRNELVDLL